MQKLIIVLFLLIPIKNIWAWGEKGHSIIAEYALKLANPVAVANCKIEKEKLITHVNDPDRAWKQQRFFHPHESKAHYFHVDEQPADWRNRSSAKDMKQGFLVYRIVDWTAEAKTLRQKEQWEKLQERFYGLVHYLGDLTQPLHVHHDHNGVEAKLPGVHSQFETKMINRYEKELRARLTTLSKTEKIPIQWTSANFKQLIFDTAENSYKKVPDFFSKTKRSIAMQKSKNKSAWEKIRFVKKRLWANTQNIAVEQLWLGAKLSAFLINDVCQK